MDALSGKAEWLPGVFDRSQQDEWAMKGSKDAFGRANEKAQSFPAEHELEPLAEEVETVFEDALAERKAARKG